MWLYSTGEHKSFITSSSSSFTEYRVVISYGIYHFYIQKDTPSHLHSRYALYNCVNVTLCTHFLY